MFFTALKDLVLDTLDELDTVAADACDAINIKKQSDTAKEEDK